jgi:hypothetical protein
MIHSIGWDVLHSVVVMGVEADLDRVDVHSSKIPNVYNYK